MSPTTLPAPVPVARPALVSRVARQIVRLAVIYFGVLAVLLAFENRLLFRPSSASEFWADPPSSHFRDVHLTAADGTSLHAWWRFRSEGRGALLYLHGNGGNLSHRGRVAEAMSEVLEVSVLLVDYPGYGKSDGRPSEAGCYAAADAAYDWLTTEGGMAGGEVVLYGDSLGGGVAVDLARRRPHRALVLSKTFTSIPDVAQRLYFWLPVKWLVRNRFDSLAKIADCGRPVFVTHGDSDSLVPFELGQRLYEAAPGPKRFLAQPGCDHNHPQTREVLVAVRDFLAECAPVASSP